jgi:hypothetical protein
MTPTEKLNGSYLYEHPSFFFFEKKVIEPVSLTLNFKLYKSIILNCSHHLVFTLV